MDLVCQHECKQKAQNRSSVNAFQATMEQPSRTIVHAKLEMTNPESQEEVEADAVANDIVQGGKIARSILAGSAGGGMAVSSQMEGRLNSMQGGGQTMPDGLRNMMERGFNHDFSQVRLHTDSEAASLSSSIHAKAFTHGNDIYFNQGQFSPNTSEGQKLMAHELTHVVQGGGKVGRELDFSGKAMMNEFYERPDGSKTILPSALQTLPVGIYTQMKKNVEGEGTDYEAIIRKDMDKTLEVVNYCIEYLENMDDKNMDAYNDYFNMPSRIKYVLGIYRKIKNVIEKRRIYFSVSLINQNDYAFVFQNDGRYAIALTHSYFQQSDSGRVNTLVHELAHEVDNNITDVAYGIDNVRGLSGTESAIANASNYGFFAESILSQKEFNEKILDEMFHTNLIPNSQNLFNLSPFLFSDLKYTPTDKDPSLISPPVNPCDTSVKIPEFDWLIYPGFNPLSLNIKFKF